MSRLQKITFDCEVLTPMFLGGANQQSELREASVRGFLRFWWRAAFSKEKEEPEELQNREAELFGGTVEKQGQSSVQIRIIKKDLQIASDLWTDLSVKRPGFNKDQRRQTGENQGIGFLYYSKAPTKDKKFEFIKPQSTFEVQMTALNHEDLKLVAEVFYLGSKLGGLGSRSRRTAGSFMVKSVNVSGSSDITLGSFESFYKEQLAFLKNQNGSRLEHSNLLGARVFESIATFETWDAAVNELGSQYEKFRFQNRKNIYLTPVLGAPVMHNRNQAFVASYNESGEYKTRERRASPIYMTIVHDGEKYKWVVTYLNGKIFPDGYRIANTFHVRRDSDDRNSMEIDLTLLNPDNPFFKNYTELK